MESYLNIHILVKSLIHNAPTIINKSKKFGVTGHDARHVVGDLKYFFQKIPYTGQFSYSIALLKPGSQAHFKKSNKDLGRRYR